MAAKEELVLQLFDLYWFKLQILVTQQQQEESSNPQKLPFIHVNKPLSNHFSISKEISHGRTESPNSVLAHSSFDSIVSDEESDHHHHHHHQKKKRMKERRRLRKSLAELEMEELKGFRELGFALSEESPRLVSILPGLRRLKERDDGGAAIKGGGEKERAVSRPYLSEKWRWKEAEMAPLLRWRIPASRSEVDMKKSLKMWARTVASAVT